MRNNNAELLRRFDSLPDLLTLAKEQWNRNSNLYQIQDTLREDFRSKGVAFRWSMPVRFLWHCQKCGQKFTQVLYELENPEQGNLVKTSFSHIHVVREHDFEMDEPLKTFLSGVNSTTA